jgi:GAF domain-containing protein
MLSIENKISTYRLLLQQIEGLLNTDDPIITNLSNIVAAINQTFDDVSWVGFYLRKEDYLYLGPFQGKVACTKIKIGNGVCGKAASKKSTLVVPNVHEFPGHIACDVESNSEIVIPIIANNELIGVLDLDSTTFSTFDEVDQEWLEKICNLLSTKINFKFKILN